MNLYYSSPGLPVRAGADAGYSNPEKTRLSRVDEIERNLNVYLMAIDNRLISLYSLTGLNFQQMYVPVPKPRRFMAGIFPLLLFNK